MNAQLNYMIARHRSAELQRAGERTRIATDVPAMRRRLRDQNTITPPSAEPARGTTALEGKRAIGGAR
jgi:hypothetical protein